MEKKLLACLLIRVCINSTCFLLFIFLHCLLVSISSTLLACLLVLVALMHFACLLLVYMHACLVHLHVCLINNTRSLYCWSIKFVSHVLHVCAWWSKCFPLLIQVHHFTLSLLYLIVVYSILQAPPQDHPWQGWQGQTWGQPLVCNLLLVVILSVL